MIIVIKHLLRYKGGKVMTRDNINIVTTLNNLRRRNKFMRNRICLSVLLITGLFLISFQGYAQIATITKFGEKLASELIEFVIKKGGKELGEEVIKKVGKETIEEISEKAVKELGESGAKTFIKELGTKTVRYGTSDVIWMVNKYGVKQTDDILKLFGSLSDDVARAGIQFARSHPDDFSKLISQYGKEFIEAEIKHPGLSAPVGKLLGKEGVSQMKNLSRDQVLTLLRNESKLTNLSPGDKSKILTGLKNSPQAILETIDKAKTKNDLILGLAKIATAGAVAVYAIKEFSEPKPHSETTSPDGTKKTEYSSTLTSQLGEGINKAVEKIGQGLFYAVIIFSLLVGSGVGMFYFWRGLKYNNSKTHNHS